MRSVEIVSASQIELATEVKHHELNYLVAAEIASMAYATDPAGQAAHESIDTACFVINPTSSQHSSSERTAQGNLYRVNFDARTGEDPNELCGRALRTALLHRERNSSVSSLMLGFGLSGLCVMGSMGYIPAADFGTVIGLERRKISRAGSRRHTIAVAVAGVNARDLNLKPVIR